MFRRALFAILGLVLSAGFALAQPLPVPSTWQNQLGSYLVVNSIDGSDNFKGTYWNYASGTQCQGTPFDVTGMTSGAKIVFVVTWKNSSTSCNPLTEWIGSISGSTIYTSWQLAYPDMNSGNIQIQYGNDTFQRIAAMPRGKMKRKR